MAKGKGKGKSAPTPQAQVSAAAAAQVPSGFKAKRMITMPTLTMKDASPPRVLRFDSRMSLSTYVDPDPKKQNEKPATIADVTDMVSGEIFKFLVPSVVEANIRRDYDAKAEVEGTGKNARIVKDTGEHTYVGKCFQIQCMGKRPGKRYRDFSIVEVEAEAKAE